MDVWGVWNDTLAGWAVAFKAVVSLRIPGMLWEGQYFGGNLVR
jgi:hypothetical protein